MFKKAERTRSKLRLALIGPSGSGKTYSALLIAEGLGGRIAVVDTENGSASLYSDLTDYDVCELQAPFTAEKYINAIQEAERGGYQVLVIDSLSHAWAGQGGLLDQHDKITKSSSSKNSFMAWREITPLHNKLVDSIVQSSCHVIITLRTKTSYEVQERDGKKVPVKIALDPVFRAGIEYEATVCLDLSVSGHVATATKDRTSLFDGQYFVPGRDTGQILKEWLSGGRPDDGHKENKPVDNDADKEAEAEPVADPAPASKKKSHDVFTRKKQEQEPKPPQPLTPEDNGVTVASLVNTMRELGLSDKLDLYEAYLLGKYGNDLRKLTKDQVNEQYHNLCRCKRDQELFQRFVTYLDGLSKKQAA